MSFDAQTGSRTSKGERTAQRILDAAEELFAQRGYDGTPLREIAQRAGIREPGLYNHFANKQALYESVLDRALAPLAAAMNEHMQHDNPIATQTSSLPAVMTDLLLDHPSMAALFQQALLGDREALGNRLIQGWLDRLVHQAVTTLESLGFDQVDRADLAIRTIAMFNLTTGYFLSQRLFEAMSEGELTSPENITRQKKLLARLAATLATGLGE